MSKIESFTKFLTQILVEHPKISSFEWVQGQTPASSPTLLSLIILLYLSLTFILSHLLKTPHPSLLHILSPLHNLLILFLSLAMAIGCSLSTLSQAKNLNWVFCFPPTPPKGPVFFWAYIFFLSKIYELIDTFLIILSGDKRRLSFLHVYHHAVVLIMSWVWIKESQSLMPIALVTNASVHVVMYGYYLCSSLGWRWGMRWKRLVTNCQIVQFVFSFLVSLRFLWLHFNDGGCSGMGGWLFNAVFNGSLLFLFLDFHKKNYRASAQRKKDSRKNA